MTARARFRAVAGLVLVASAAAAPTVAAGLDLDAAPKGIRIGALFAGSKVELSGAADAAADVVIEVFGPEESALFHLKGRVGPLWMNVQEVELRNAPHLYLLLTSDELESGLDLGALGLGLESVEMGITVHPYSLDKDMIFEQFLKLKRPQRLYDERPSAIFYQPLGGGRRAFRAAFVLPSSTAPGAYRVVASAVDDGRVAARTVVDIWVEEAGVIEAIHDLAVDHGLIYGIASVIIALAVGGLIGVVFRRAGAH